MFDAALSLVKAFSNWHLVLLDRAGVLKKPYVLSTNDGLKIEIRPNSGDRFTAWETCVRNVYFRQGQELKQGQTVVDIGANIGCFTLLAARIVGPDGRVIAFEPDPQNLEQLKRNISLNGLTNVTVLSDAVGDRTGEVDLYGGSSSLFPSVFDNVDNRSETVANSKVSMVKLSDALERCAVDRVDYLKLDCEGGEYLILPTVSKELADRISQITMEVHRVPGYELKDLKGSVKDLGYQIDSSELIFCWR